MKTASSIPSTDHVQNQVTWIGGPTHRLQRQHVPGYAGHIHGLIAESQHGKTFARTSAECLQQRNAVGQNPDIKERFGTNYKLEYSKPDLRKPEFQSRGERIVQGAKREEQIINEIRQKEYQQAPKSIEDIPPIDRLPVVGYQGFRPVFKHPLKQVQPPKEPEQFVHPFRQTEEQQLINTFNQDPDLCEKFEANSVPIVGYTGFLKGVKAENMYGETFMDTTSKVVRNK